MNEIIKVVLELGSYGLLLSLAGYIIYDYVKNKSVTKKSNTDSSVLNKEIKEIINYNFSEIKTSINSINDRVVILENSVKEIKDSHHNIMSDKTSHPKQFLDRLKLGPQLHKILNSFRIRINCDHIFIGSFHNGNESITGIPYYKFDIIAERFRPDKVERDIEFAPMYKDNDLLRHDLLPSEVVQMGVVHYIIDENGESNLKDVDDIIYRRMVGRNIKQLAIALLSDPITATPSGFVGCVKYNYEEIDLNELKECAVELERTYETNEKLIIDKLKLN
jgi:hypothetical protein